MQNAHSSVRTIALMGSTGSIGRQTLDIVRAFPDHFRVVALAARNSIDLLQQQVEEFHPDLIVSDTDDDAIFADLRARYPHAQRGLDGLVALATHPAADIVVAANSGLVGLRPVMAAIHAGKTIALANKETLVMAGHIVMPAARRFGVDIRPVDSEHSAIWQCLRGEDLARVQKLIITASGGPFRTMPLDEMQHVTAQQALKHPTWVMGPKITIDSATLMNKGLEMIEAAWLFDMRYDQLEAVVHPQSIIHSMVQFVDGSIKMQATLPTMHLPIQEALSYPDRLDGREKALLAPLHWPDIGSLTFAELDQARFPCFRLALEAGQRGGGYPAVLTGADESAVALFLRGEIGLMDIPARIERTLEAWSGDPVPDIDAVLNACEWARDYCEHLPFRQ